MLHSLKHLFSLDPEVAYLNCSYMSPLLRSVEAAGIEGLTGKRSPNRISVEDFFNPVLKLKKAFSTLIGEENHERIAVIPSVSYGVAMAAHNIRLNKGEKIIISDQQFPSNVFEWQKLADRSEGRLIKISPPDSFEQRGQKWNERILEAIDVQTKVVALPHFHWADGTRFDLNAIREKTLEVGALLIIDGTQSLGAYPFDVTQFRPDAVFAGGYKWLMGPYGMGLAWMGPWFDDKQPLEENWINRAGSSDFSRLANYEPAYQPFARRYDMGEQSNFILVPMLTAGIEWLNDIGTDFIQKYCEKLMEPAWEELAAAGFWVESPAWRSRHLLGLFMPAGLDINYLKAELERNKIYISVRGKSMRISPHVYNEPENIDRLVQVIKDVSVKHRK
ncbi:MAG: aminotransferase class V-fold PLP-dependent enzyme [Bacteroidia bacterium]